MQLFNTDHQERRSAEVVGVWDAVVLQTYMQSGPKNGTVFWYTLTTSNINPFSKLFHGQNQEKMCNNIITKDPTTPHIVKCRVS